VSQTKANPFRPHCVVEISCDHCGKPMDSVLIMQARGVKMIAKAYHETCWTRDVLPHTKLQRSN
jgi:hypothetical protein